jgi:hypothetical protein
MWPFSTSELLQSETPSDRSDPILCIQSDTNTAALHVVQGTSFESLVEDSNVEEIAPSSISYTRQQHKSLRNPLRSSDTLEFGLSRQDEAEFSMEFKQATDANAEQLQVTSRLLDHRAAVLIAGAAGMPNVHTVWVDTSPNRAWLDKLDERRLMKLAYDVADSRSEYVQRMHSVVTGVPNLAPATENAREVSHEVVDVMMKFRQEFIKNHVVCLAPVAEAAMAELTHDLLEDKIIQPVSHDAAILTQGLDEPGVCVVHDRSHALLLSRLLRRHPKFSASFCQIVGKMVAYRSALQHGSAFTRLRLIEMRHDMLREKRRWSTWIDNIKVKKEVQTLYEKCAGNPGSYAVSFDWVSLALRELDQRQTGSAPPPQPNKKKNKRSTKQSRAPRHRASKKPSTSGVHAANNRNRGNPSVYRHDDKSTSSGGSDSLSGSEAQESQFESGSEFNRSND